MPFNRTAPPHHTLPFRPERNATLDTLRWARKRHAIPILLEIDVTEARQAIRERRRVSGSGLSLTAWIVGCVARAAAEHPRVHALRRGRLLVLFEEVDVAVLVERSVGTEGGQESLPMPTVIRSADRKSLTEIHDEIRRAQGEEVPEGAASIEPGPPPWLQSLFFRMPWWLRDLVFWRPLFRNPTRIKQTMGTVVVSSTGMAAPGVLAWGIPSAVHPLAVGVGGITRRGEGDERHEVLALSIVFDHTVTDGAPVGRFVRRLNEIVTRAEGLGVVAAGSDPQRAAEAQDPA